MTENNTSDKPGSATESKATDNKTADNKPADKTGASATQAGSANTDAEKSASGATGTAATGTEDKKAPPKKAAPTKAAARKMTDEEKKKADESIKSKQSVEELKARAAAAKKRAQEKILEKSYVSDPPIDPLERLADTFDNSARRWEMVVYPSLFAFVLLAGYGFFLIYRLTHDISTLSQSVTRMAVIVSDAMPRMTRDLNVMTDSMDNMTGNIANMSGDIDGMSNEMSAMSVQMETLTPMSHNIRSMTSNLGNMNMSVYGMQRDMHGMNRTVSSGPFGMMNDMMPFSSNTNVPPPLAPPVVWPTYNATPGPYQYQQPLQMFPSQSAGTVPVNPAQTNPAPVENRGGNKASPDSSRPHTDDKNIKSVKPASEINHEILMPGASPVVLKSPVISN